MACSLPQTPPFAPLVEMWRDPLSVAGDLPTDFLLAWISCESGGNACSYTSMRESGIFQLMPPDNTRDGNTTEDALRTACVPGIQATANGRQVNNLTPDEIDEQVRSGITYVRHVRDVARARLAAVGANWDESSGDFWAMVKLVHTLPSLMNGLEIATANLGRPPESWDEFVQYGAQGLNGAQKWLPFAAEIGRFGQGFNPAPFAEPGGTGFAAAAIFGLIIGAWIYTHRRMR
jgi:hypothetical protein